MNDINSLRLLQKQSLATARQSGLKHYQGYAPCKYGHIGDRLVSTQQCCKCLEIRKKGQRKDAEIPANKVSRIKRAMAVNMGSTHYFTGKACKNGHIAKRLVSTRQCVECLSERNRVGERYEPTELATRRSNAKRRSKAGKIKQRKYYDTVLKHDAGFLLRRKAYDEINNALRWNSGKIKTSIGYTSDELRERIESQFKIGMSWDNRGEWEIDHRKPISAFIAEGIDDLILINALENLQPLWKEENATKGSKFVA